MPTEFLLLILIGLILGTFGTLIGAGGGFVLMPVLLLLYPDSLPQTITSISLAVVCMNALSGSISYARMKRIDYRAGLLFAAAAIPGSILGVISTGYIERSIFNILFGVLLIGISAFLLLRPEKTKDNGDLETGKETKPNRHFNQTIIERNGSIHRYSYNSKIGTGLSLIIGYLSSLFGIGGGIIHVPVMTHILRFPVHVATATSLFILTIITFTATVVHILKGSFDHQGYVITIALSIGVLFGAQCGVYLSSKVKGTFIIRCLAFALALAGLRIICMY